MLLSLVWKTKKKVICCAKKQYLTDNIDFYGYAFRFIIWDTTKYFNKALSAIFVWNGATQIRADRQIDQPAPTTVRFIALNVKMDSITDYRSLIHMSRCREITTTVLTSLSLARRWGNSGILQQNISLYPNSVTATFAPVMVCR